MLSVRPGWGIVGRQPGGEGLFFSKYGTGAGYLGEGSTYPRNIQLKNLKWEQKETYNLGTDFGFFDDRLTGISYNLKTQAALEFDIEAGENKDRFFLNLEYDDTLQPTTDIDENAALTWMRQPHYYMGLYPYTYSAGLTVATQAMLRIRKEGEAAVSDWKNFLSAGGTADPVGLAKIAGFDITTDGPLNATIDYISSVIDEICALTEQLDGIRIPQA